MSVTFPLRIYFTIKIITSFFFHCNIFLKGLYGNWYFRPEDTFHLASRKFMEQEVFRSLHSSFITFQNIIGKCYVMSVKDYPKYKPEVCFFFLMFSSNSFRNK